MRTTLNDIKNLALRLTEITGKTYVIQPTSDYYNLCVKNERGGARKLASGSTRELEAFIEAQIELQTMAKSFERLLGHVFECGAAATPAGGTGPLAYNGTIYAEVRAAINQLSEVTGNTYTVTDERKPRLIRQN